MTIDEQGVLDIWAALRGQIDALITEKTANCVRACRATVQIAPDAGTGKISVLLPFSSAPVSLPYSSAASTLTAGAQCWVLIPCGTLSNGVVVQNGSWTL